MLNSHKIGEKISLLRRNQKLSQLELAEKLYVTRQAVSKWENGHGIPSIEILIQITKLFNISIDCILDDSEIRFDDYVNQFRQYPRETVIYRFLRNKDNHKNIEKIFYLLNEYERNQMIHLLLTKRLNVELSVLWHILSEEERRYVLKAIIGEKYTYDIKNLSNRLSESEELLLGKDYR